MRKKKGNNLPSPYLVYGEEACWWTLGGWGFTRGLRPGSVEVVELQSKPWLRAGGNNGYVYLGSPQCTNVIWLCSKDAVWILAAPWSTYTWPAVYSYTRTPDWGVMRELNAKFLIFCSLHSYYSLFPQNVRWYQKNWTKQWCLGSLSLIPICRHGCGQL